MPRVTVYRCDLTDCTITAESEDGPPPGWVQVTENGAGISTTVLCGHEHLIAWTGVIAERAADVTTAAQARKVLAEHRARRTPKPSPAR